jgi:dihydropteroate synthase
MNRATSWQLRTRRLTFSLEPLVMGIVNVTPDSFSDGGRFFESGPAVDHALRLAAEGADILDVGGESTRPYSSAVDTNEELRRVIPVVRDICRQTDVPVSIDTSKAAIARQAIDCGAEIVNDVTALEGDPQMPQVVLTAGVGICAMHMQGTPQTMQDRPHYRDVVEDIADYLRARRDELENQGLSRDRICLDPGIGFGKTHQHNLTLLANCQRLLELECPILVGHSRKGFIAKVLGDKEADRTFATIGVALALAAQRVHVLRVHDVGPLKQALHLFAAAGGIDGQPLILPKTD